MTKELQVMNIDNVQEIKLDKTIQDFLERRNFEYFDIQKMEIEENTNIEFIKISHITYDRSKDDSDLQLIDFQQILSAISSYSGKFVYRIEGTIEGINLYLGSSNNKFLKNSFEGIYSGSETSLDQPINNTYKYTKAMLGIPSLKRDSDKSFKQSLEKILFPMQSKEFRITLIAEAYQLETIQEIISSYQSLGDELHKFVKQTKSIQESEANTEGTTDTKSRTKGSSKSSTKGTSQKSKIGVLLPMLGLGGIGGILGTNAEVGSKLGSGLHEFAPDTVDKLNKIYEQELVDDPLSGTEQDMSLLDEAIEIGKGVRDKLSESWEGASSTLDGGDELAQAGVEWLGPILGGAIGLGLGGAGGMIFGKMISNSITNTQNKSRTNASSINKSKTNTTLKGLTFDEINKSAAFCETMIDTHIERFQKGLNHGMWNSTLYIESDNNVTLQELEHILKSVYSGDQSFYEPIRFTKNNLTENINFNMENYPSLYMEKNMLQHPIHTSFSGYSTAINTEELSLLTALPSNDLDGISVTKTSSFGLTQKKIKDTSINIGNILNKKKMTSQRFLLSEESINSHVFVSGITGSGKSNTIKLILEEMYTKTNIPFLVIEPAKSEYKNLLNKIKGLQVFRPGAKGDIFSFNPFIFEYSQDENSTTLIQHVDMLKTTFSSAFPMYGPMPYILEEAIHKIYENKGWDFNTQHHVAYTFAGDADYDRRNLLFPTMEDLKNIIDNVVENAGYADEMNMNIKAALKTRINNLTIGSKGKVFNSRHCFSDAILFSKPTIIELSNIIDDEEKSFLMGLILNKLYRYRILHGQKVNKLNHITVIEEAHRLLPNIQTSNNQESSDTKAKAVETFTNILAEIRSFGEGIIVADQIATKLHSDVIKNTNVKILHRTMSKDDREIIGESINLSENQILDIAELKTGQAIVHNKDVHQAFMVQIDKNTEMSLNVNNNEVKAFYKVFLSENIHYKYEYIGEDKFYDESYLNHIIDKEKVRILTKDFIQLINMIFMADIKTIKNQWNIFIQKFTLKERKIILYQCVYIWKSLSILSNLDYYESIDSYLKSTKRFFNVLHNLNTSNEKTESSIQKFILTYEHENINVVFPMMIKYDLESIDYTLLLAENFVNNPLFIEIHKNEFEGEFKSIAEINNKIEIVLTKIFLKHNVKIKESFLAMKFKDFSLKEETYMLIRDML